jgi:flagellar hook-associated protein 3 FlgL
MRIADKMNFEQVKSNLGKNRSDMADLQNQAATQKRVTKPSDDPLAATRILASKSDISSGQQFVKSVSQAKSFLESSDQCLGELTDLLVRAKELALSQSNDASSGRQTRFIAATEVEQLHAQAVQVGNRKQGDRFLFGGFRTSRPPFDAKGRYSGDDGEMKIAINKEAHVAMNIPGRRVFLGASELARPSRDKANQIEKPEKFDSVDSVDGEVVSRGPASEAAVRAAFADSGKFPSADSSSEDNDTNSVTGVSVFKVLHDLEIGLRANDKGSIQDSIDSIDAALNQVVTARAQLGSRTATLTSTTEGLQKAQVDSKVLVSNLEDVDTFELVSDINKNESTLKATLETSGKLIQPSLLDFLK